MLPAKLLPSLLFLCSFSLASPPPSLSFSPPLSEASVDFVAIATAFSPEPALSSSPQTASISAIDPAANTTVTAPVKSAQALAQHERDLIEQRINNLDRIVSDPQFLVETEQAYTLKDDCKTFIRDFKQLVKIGSQGYQQIMQHQEQINAVTSKASAMVVSLASMNVPGAAIAISQLLPDVANLVKAVAPDLLEMIKAAAPVAARLLSSVVRIPANTVRKIKHNVRKYMCDVDGKRKKKLSERRMKRCIAKGYFPKGYNPEKDYDPSPAPAPGAEVVERKITTDAPLADQKMLPILGGAPVGDNVDYRDAAAAKGEVRKGAPAGGRVAKDPTVRSRRRVKPSTPSTPDQQTTDQQATSNQEATSNQQVTSDQQITSDQEATPSLDSWEQVVGDQPPTQVNSKVSAEA